MHKAYTKVYMFINIHMQIFTFLLINNLVLSEQLHFKSM